MSFKKALTVSSMIMLFDSMPRSFSRRDRFIVLVMRLTLRILVVCHWFKKSHSVIRIISAGKATRRESAQYGR